MKKSQGIRAAISAINTYGILVVPGLVDQRTAAGCAANADAALGESLLSRDGSSPCRYAVQLGLTHATRAAVLAVRGSAPMASALAAQLGDDAALCELSCEMSDGGAPIKPMHCATPACVEDAQTHYQEALAQRVAEGEGEGLGLCVPVSRGLEEREGEWEREAETGTGAGHGAAAWGERDGRHS
jgi:hypothetical protein